MSLSILNKYPTFAAKSEVDKADITIWLSEFLSDFKLGSYDEKKVYECLFAKSPTYVTISSLLPLMFVKKREDLPSNLEYLLKKYKRMKLPEALHGSSSLFTLAESLYSRLFEDRYTSAMSEDNFQNMLPEITLIVQNLPKKNYFLKSALLDIGSHYYADDKREKMMLKLFTLMVKNNIYNKSQFSDILTLLYCRSTILLLQILAEHDTSLFIVTPVLLSKIVFYGRDQTLAFLIENARDQLNAAIIEQNPLVRHNPYDMSNFYFVNDIWGGNSWGNDECDRENMIQPNFEETFALLDSLHYEHVQLTNELTLKWFNLSRGYSIDDDYLLSKLNVNVELSKAGIENMIAVIGLQNTWEIIKREGSRVLTVLLN